jgi:exosome complex RNA-binding protein Rrp42 (RNase PH superfamily)
VETGLLPQANGSARLRLVTGGTDVLAAVKAEVVEPAAGKPNDGRLECSVECWSSASPQFEGRGAAEINAELTRTLTKYGEVCG